MSDWHFTQDGAGLENGTSEANAWAVADIVWGGAGVVAGDNLKVHGDIYSRLVVGASGTSGNPIRIIFAPGARIWPSVDESSSWTIVGSGPVYYRTVTGGYRYSMWANDALVPPIGHDNSPDTRGTEAALMTENTWRMRGSTEMMFYAPGGVDPSTLDSVRATDRGSDGGYGAIDLRGHDHITVIDMNVRGARWNAGLPAAFTTEGDGITIIGGTVEHCERICKVYGGTGFGIIGLTADDLISTGISLLGASSAETPVSHPLSNVAIRHNRITNVGYTGRYRGIDWSITGDNDAIGIGYEGGNCTDIDISDNYIENIGPQWAKDADVPSYFTSTNTERGAGVYVGTAEVVAIDVTNVSVLRNTFKGISRFSVHLGAECAGASQVIGNVFEDTGRYVSFDATVLVQATENASYTATVAQNTFTRALARSAIKLQNAGANDSRYLYNNLFVDCDKVTDGTGDSWQGDVWRSTSGTWAPTADLEDYSFHGDRAGLSSANIARDSADATFTTLAAYRAATDYADNSIQDTYSVSLIAGIGTKWWADDLPYGEDGNRFYKQPSMGAYEVRRDKKHARELGAVPLNALRLGGDLLKARTL